MKKREKGPVEILCKEIGFRFDRRMERQDLFVSFVSVLVSQVAGMREMQMHISTVVGGKLPSQASEDILRRVEIMLASDDPLSETEELHSFADEVSPDDAHSCDHLIDMLNSCVSAIRFGLETPCRSRHAAEAASHIWGKLYGISLFDEFTPKWEGEWARAQFQEAMFRLVTK